MKEFKYVIKDAQGMHARPAGLLKKQAAGYESAVTIAKDGKEADAKGIFGVMGLGVKQGTEIVVKADGPDEDKAIAELEVFFNENL